MYVSYMVGVRNSYRVLFAKKKTEEKRPLGKPNNKWCDNIRANIEEEPMN